MKQVVFGSAGLALALGALLASTGITSAWASGLTAPQGLETASQLLYVAQADIETDLEADDEAGDDAGEEISEEEFAALMEAGAQHFQDFCAACHGSSGRGDIGPSLTGNARLADAAAIYRLISSGGNEMPGFDGVLDEDGILSVGTYIRNSWGNEFGPMTLENTGRAGDNGEADEESAAE